MTVYFRWSFIGAPRSVAERAKAGDESLCPALRAAPPAGRTAAARTPVLARRYLTDEDD